MLGMPWYVDAVLILARDLHWQDVPLDSIRLSCMMYSKCHRQVGFQETQPRLTRNGVDTCYALLDYGDRCWA